MSGQRPPSHTQPYQLGASTSSGLYTIGGANNPPVQRQPSYGASSHPFSVGKSHPPPPSSQPIPQQPPKLEHSGSLSSQLIPPSAYAIRKKESAEVPPTTVGKKKNVRKKKRGADRVLPARLQEEFSESLLYGRLIEFEKKIDATVMRKRLDVQEALKKPNRTKRTVRLFISNRAYNQGEIDAFWILKIEGRMLDDPNMSKYDSNKTRKKFSTFFDRIYVELQDETIPPENRIIEWKRSLDTFESDGFEIKRPGRQNTKCKILLFLDHQPSQFQLMPALSNVLGIHTATRADIVMSMWQYIKTHKLQDKSDHSIINNDFVFQSVFGCKSMSFSSISDRIAPFLAPPEPLEIDYEITVNEEQAEMLCFDVEVKIHDAQTQHNLHTYRLSSHDSKEINECDTVISNLISEINEHKDKRDFMKGVSEDPVDFIQKWIASQSRDLKFAGDLPGNYEEERRADYYTNPWVEEAVWKYLGEKMQKKRMGLEQTLHDLKTKRHG